MGGNSQYMNMLTTTNICTDQRSGSIPCNGDSGGGLYVLENGYWTLRGVLSKSIVVGDGETCSKDDYAVYENIWKFMSFIREHL
jgi:secreted trypsin-like serine protease